MPHDLTTVIHESLLYRLLHAVVETGLCPTDCGQEHYDALVLLGLVEDPDLMLTNAGAAWLTLTEGMGE